MDLTGQCIWEAADVLSQYICDSLAKDFEGKNVIEVGSGTGLCGLVSANYAQNVVLTDYQEVVLKLIDMNIDLQKKPANVYSAMLDWTKSSDEYM